jgi:hypothetical protein
MKDLKERENEARERLAERLARLKSARRRELASERRSPRAAVAPAARTEPEAPVFWWNQ